MTDKENLWNKQFGINEPACLHKWQWSTLFLEQQKSSSCHRPHAEDVTIENFDDFHNTPGVLEARRKMRDGIWPGKGCEYCRDIEAVGGLSDRQQINNNPMLIEQLTPKEFTEDPTSIRMTPRTLEVNFSNLCNNACLYCFSRCSSKIETEQRKYFLEDNGYEVNATSKKNQKHANFLEDMERKQKYDKMKERFWQWMEKNATQLFNYRVLGGEPFYQPELWENIEFFQNNPCPDLNITIFTNLNVDPIRFDKALAAFKELKEKKHLKSIILTISSDSLGPAEEYVRFGSKMPRWNKNFDLLQEKYTMFHVSILSTLCNLNIKSAINIVRRFNESNFSGRKWSAMHFNIAHGHPHLLFDIFPYGFFDEDFDLLIAETTEPHFKEQITGYKKVANAGEYRPDLIKDLKVYLDKIDKRRKLNWRETFPWLESFNPNDYKK